MAHVFIINLNGLWNQLLYEKECHGLKSMMHDASKQLQMCKFFMFTVTSLGFKLRRASRLKKAMLLSLMTLKYRVRLERFCKTPHRGFNLFNDTYENCQAFEILRNNELFKKAELWLFLCKSDLRQIWRVLFLASVPEICEGGAQEPLLSRIVIKKNVLRTYSNAYMYK